MDYIAYSEVDELTGIDRVTALARWPEAVGIDHLGRPVLRAEGPHRERYIISFYENQTGGYWANMAQS